MDGTELKQDTSLKGDFSVAGKETSTQTPGTSIEKQIEKAVSDALSKAGRTAKALSELETRLTAGMAELTAKQVAWQKEKDEAEEEVVMDDPEALTALRARRAKKTEEEAKVTELTKRETELAKRETELADIIERDKIINRTQLAAEVAVEKGVSIDAILKLAKEDTREAYEAAAEFLPRTKEVLISDSSRMNRGGGSWESVRNAYIKNPDDPVVFNAYMEMRNTRK